MIFTSPEIETRATEWKKDKNGKWIRLDEWGNLWERLDSSSKGEVVKGAVDSLDELDNYEFPDYSSPSTYRCVKEIRKLYSSKWLIGSVPGMAFSIARKIRSLDRYLMDLVLEPDAIHEMHNRIDIIIEDMIRNYAAAGADSIMFWEDWGTQNQLFISPEMWQNEFFPRFQKLCKIAHKLNLKVFMHSCGKIDTIIPYLIKAGIDVFQFDQAELHGLDKLAEYQKNHKVSFWCPVDIQKTLQTCNEDLIRAEAREMLDKLWKGIGGFIAGFYEDNQSIGLKPEYQQYACDEFIKYGVN